MTAFLAQMAASSRERVRVAKQTCSPAMLAGQARNMRAPSRLQLDASGFDLIAELKLRSPAAGPLGRQTDSVAGRVVAYARAGAAAVSVLTEPSRFDGTLAHLRSAAGALAPLAVPAGRGDFLVDPCKVREARVAGAGGVLVILRLLPRQDLAGILDCASALGLFVLLEAFDAHDIELMHELIAVHRGSNQLLAGVNCRDLASLEIVPRRLIELAPLLPVNVPRVAESGVVSTTDAARVAAAGYTLALVGSALMQGKDPAGLAAQLLAAGRAARRQT
ncbi:MAG: indole-3-glycerol phosphate synthase TrpC [Steroidobacteraceae bacterium]